MLKHAWVFPIQVSVNEEADTENHTVSMNCLKREVGARRPEWTSVNGLRADLFLVETNQPGHCIFENTARLTNAI
jgi:hypothetical protein